MDNKIRLSTEAINAGAIAKVSNVSKAVSRCSVTEIGNVAESICGHPIAVVGDVAKPIRRRTVAEVSHVAEPISRHPIVTSCHSPKGIASLTLNGACGYDDSRRRYDCFSDFHNILRLNKDALPEPAEPLTSALIGNHTRGAIVKH